MMKNHNRELCAAAGRCRHSDGPEPRPHSAPGLRRKKDRVVVSSTADESGSESESEFTEMMDQLTEEYTHMAASVLIHVNKQ